MLSLMSSIVRTLYHFLIRFLGAYTFDRLIKRLQERCSGLMLPPNSGELSSLQLHFMWSYEMQLSHFGRCECSHCYLPLFLYPTLYIFYRECVKTSECIRTAYPPLLYQALPLYSLPQVLPCAYPAFVSCYSPSVLSLRQ